MEATISIERPRFNVTPNMKREIQKHRSETIIGNRINGGGTFSPAVMNDVLWVMSKKRLLKQHVIQMFESSQKIIDFFAQVKSDPVYSLYLAFLEQENKIG